MRALKAEDELRTPKNTTYDTVQNSEEDKRETEQNGWGQKEENEDVDIHGRMEFRRLIEVGSLSAEERALMTSFWDHPMLAIHLVNMRRTHGRPGIQQKRLRCFCCEEFIEGMPIAPHETRFCPIPFEFRFLYIKRRFRDVKCLRCGKIGNFGNVCGCKYIPCKRCWHSNQPEVMPHTLRTQDRVKRWSCIGMEKIVLFMQKTT
ncbi:hypothetical protein L5515_004994 [Caenorhabditis briggsae]|uniref:Uncharacterized protein n=1 Tax=Caenorhabditis briggsae TaxID=6238 RepID=A0AAE9EJ52_CAEBR|nr:hypothetical protein L5515_004994 [Caenorhabditis briggsae]